MTEQISIIVPLFEERENVSPLVAELQKVLDAQSRPFEIILVDDGSKDGTFDAIREEAVKDGRVIGLRLRRNCGQAAAMKAGIDRARGQICITMDGDLQHSPEHIPQFIKKIEEGYDLVCGYRFQRDDAFLRRFPSRVANSIARKFSSLQLTDFGSTYRAYRTDVVKALPVYGEMHRFVPVFVGLVTDRITQIPIQLQPRLHGSSKYGLGRAFRVISDLVVLLFFSSFFSRPIHIFGYMSIALGITGFGILLWLTGNKIVGNISIMEYGPLFTLGVLLCLVAGQLFTTGVVCEYLVRIYYNDAEPYSIGEETTSAT